MARIAVIDGDIVAYMMSQMAQSKIKWADEDDEESPPQVTLALRELDEVKSRILAWIRKVTAEAKCDRNVVAVGDTENWRKSILPTYKANRDPTKKPVMLDEVKTWMRRTFAIETGAGLEGDDVIGIYCTSPSRNRNVIVSIDKDFLTIPRVEVYNPDKGTNTFVPTEMARYRHMWQTLVGDTADNYKGCPGVGAVKADKALREVPWTYEAMWPVVVEMYVKRGFTEADALLQARVARILQFEDIHNGEIKLWLPPS
jgi:hypothetical protein